MLLKWFIMLMLVVGLKISFIWLIVGTAILAFERALAFIASEELVGFVDHGLDDWEGMLHSDWPPEQDLYGMAARAVQNGVSLAFDELDWPDGTESSERADRVRWARAHLNKALTVFEKEAARYR